MVLEIVRKALDIGFRSLIFRVAKQKAFNSLLHDILFRPISASFSITERCNSKCITCSVWKRTSVNELTTNEVADILSQLRDLGILSIGFTGGEPLLRTDLPDIVQEARRLKFRRISVITNGLLLSCTRAEMLIKSGVTAIGLSIDGIGETHDIIRGVKGSFDKVLYALKTLVELRDHYYPSLDIWVSTTLTRLNIDQVREMIGLCKKLGVRFFLNLPDNNLYFFSETDLSGLWVRDFQKLSFLIDEMHRVKRENPKLLQSHTSLEYIRMYFTDPRRADIPCYLGYLSIYIGARGDIYSGCWALPPLGNLRQTSLKQIINSNEYKKRLHEMLLKRCPGCSCGYTTNLLYNLPSLFEEMLWRLHIKNP